MQKCIKKFLNNKYIFIILFIYIIFYFQMRNIVFYGDDFEVLNPLSNDQNFFNVLKFCIEKMHYFWFEWSGRILGHFSVSFVLSLGIEIFRILNPIMILLMIYLSLKILSLIREFNISAFMCIFSIVLFGMNIYLSREILYWAYSSILYIWGFNLTLLSIYLIFKNYKNNQTLSDKKFIIVIILIIAQTFILEQFSMMMIMFLGLISLVSFKNKNNFKKYFLLLLISIGTFLLSALAPGNFLRTIPLRAELELYTFVEIFWSKFHLFYKVLFNNRYLGLYFLTFCIIVNRKFLQYESSKIKKILFSCITYSFFFLFIFDIIFPNLNLLGDISSLDPNSFLDSMIASRDLGASKIRCIYFTIYLVSITYMFFKTIKKQSKFLFFAYLATLFVSVVPIVMINYCGSRYFLFFLITLILILFNFYCEDKNNFIGLKELALFLIILPINVWIKIFTVFIIGVIFIIKKFKLKNYCVFASIIVIIFSFTNIILALYNYGKNKKIYDYNESVLQNHNDNEPIVIFEIPYERSLYSWHSIALDFNNENRYYGFYINKWCNVYYGIDCDKIIILEDFKNE